MRDITDYSLLGHNTFGIDCHCRRFLEYETVEEAQQIADILREADTPYYILGAGSNLLLTCDYAGTMVHSAVRGITIKGNMLECGSGETWDNVVEQAIRHQLYGAENLSLIPGEAGASVVQNIGAYGAEVKDVVECIEAVDIKGGGVRVISPEECRYGYRDSRFKNEWKGRYLITRVVYRLNTEFHPHLDYGNIRSELQRRGISRPSPSELRQVIIDIRRQKLPDPDVTGNAGSFFMNPVVSREKLEQLLAAYPQMPHYVVDENHVKIPAGWMIEQCGWKGRIMGHVGVHPHQALVLVNRGGATGAEVMALCEAIRHDVSKMFDVEIHPEVNIL